MIKLSNKEVLWIIDILLNHMKMSSGIRDIVRFLSSKMKLE